VDTLDATERKQTLCKREYSDVKWSLMIHIWHEANFIVSPWGQNKSEAFSLFFSFSEWPNEIDSFWHTLRMTFPIATAQRKTLFRYSRTLRRDARYDVTPHAIYPDLSLEGSWKGKSRSFQRFWQQCASGGRWPAASLKDVELKK